MKHQRFEYIKESGDKSIREVIVLAEPRVTMFALDITDCDASTRKEVLEEMKVLEALKGAITQKVNKFRTFKPEGIRPIED